MIRHAGLIARRVDGLWRGVLIEGPSGCGKSDLAVRALDAGFRLVADDRTVVWAQAGQLFGRAPDTLRGLLEVRGLDVVRETAVPFAEIALIARSGAPERLADGRREELQGVQVPLLELDFREASAPAKLGRALVAFDGGSNRRM